MSKTHKNPAQAIAYVRVSTREQMQHGVSIANQEETIQAYCQMSGLTLVQTVREEGVSASIPLVKRPGGKNLLSQLGVEVHHLVVTKLDRIFRSAEDALRQTTTWNKQGVALHLLDLGGEPVNTRSAMGRMLLTMMAAFGELERNLIAERTAAALAHKKHHHQVFNHSPYGFDRVGPQLVSNPKEFAVSELIRERRKEGWTFQMIADSLNEAGVPTKLQARWYARTVKNVCESSILWDNRAQI